MVLDADLQSLVRRTLAAGNHDLRAARVASRVTPGHDSYLATSSSRGGCLWHASRKTETTKAGILQYATLVRFQDNTSWVGCGVVGLRRRWTEEYIAVAKMNHHALLTSSPSAIR